MKYEVLKEEMASLLDSLMARQEELERLLCNQSEYEEQSKKDIRENIDQVGAKIDKLDRALDILNE